ncbi:MAG TPA: helix-turn-helix domain-containing protein [Candidatus Brocadiia bacterium]|nr:helix-turn-helix domain-containing protein [Candidatus Brocadiia bacterium]
MTNDGPKSAVRDRDEEKRWYSVREAATYLAVSQPTIFRWMKEGALSFYKIGGATRFTRESMDALIEKTTGLKEAEATLGRCAACGHSALVEGRVQGTGRMYFRPEKTKFWVFSEALVPLTARVCSACGYVQMHADVEKLNRLLPEDKPAGSR